MGIEGAPHEIPQGETEKTPASKELPPHEREVVSALSDHSAEVAEIVGADFSAVLEAVKLLGPGNPENRRLVTEWTVREEEAVRRNTEREPLARASIRFNIQRAELYFAAGNIDGAIDCLYDAIDQAANEGHDDLRQEAQMRADSVTAQSRWA